MLRALLFFAYLGLAIYALLDCARTNQDEVRNLPKWAWLLIILFIQLLGSIAWLIAGKPRKRKKNNDEAGIVLQLRRPHFPADRIPWGRTPVHDDREDVRHRRPCGLHRTGLVEPRRWLCRLPATRRRQTADRAPYQLRCDHLRQQQIFAVPAGVQWNVPAADLRPRLVSPGSESPAPAARFAADAVQGRQHEWGIPGVLRSDDAESRDLSKTVS